MSDAGRDFVELKREIIEARTQAIKTANQMKNVALDVKGFEKRFDVLERRTRIASVGAHAIVALTIGLAAMAMGRSHRARRSDNREAIDEAMVTVRGW